MSIRTSVTGATWTQIGTGPATVQNLSVDVSVMVACQASAPATNSDGLVLRNQGDTQLFTTTEPIWAQCVDSALTAVLAAQPQVAP